MIFNRWLNHVNVQELLFTDPERRTNRTKNISLLKSKKALALGVGSQEHVQLTRMFYFICVFSSQQNLLGTLEIVSCHTKFRRLNWNVTKTAIIVKTLHLCTNNKTHKKYIRTLKANKNITETFVLYAYMNGYLIQSDSTQDNA